MLSTLALVIELVSVPHSGAHAVVVAASIDLYSHPSDAGSTTLPTTTNSFPQTDGDRLTANKMFRAALVSRS
jgi:hypothetical protein